MPRPQGQETLMSKTGLFGKAMAVAFVAALSLGAARSASAETQWEQSHPRRDQVNDRLANQSNRINQEVAEGELTRRQGAMLHQDDHNIRTEERLAASQNGGHITKLEQRALNQQENAVSRKIGP